jgi:DNA-binding NtrC family response regulator
MRFHEKFDEDGAAIDPIKLASGDGFFLDGTPFRGKVNREKVERPELLIFVCENMRGPVPRLLREVKDAYIRQAVAYFDGDEHAAAEALGISRQTIYNHTRLKDGIRFRSRRSRNAGDRDDD